MKRHTTLLRIVLLAAMLMSAIPLMKARASPIEEAPPDYSLTTEPEVRVGGCTELTKVSFPTTYLSPQTEQLLAMVKAAPEFRDLEAEMVSTEPNDIWQAGELTFFIFDLRPAAKPRDALLVLYPSAIFAASEDQGIVAVMVATPDLRTMQVELKDFSNPELSQTVMLSEGVAEELRQAEEMKARQSLQAAKPLTNDPESRQPLGPCRWYCTQTVYHPGHVDIGCRAWCWAGCSFIPDWKAKAACYMGCQAACWVFGWTECVKREWFCGLP